MSNRSFQKALYNALVLPTAYAALSAASAYHGKLRETFRARRGIRERWRRAARALAARPIWFHVSSVGEYEQARPVISAIAKHHPRIPIAVSFTSPSGYRYALEKDHGSGQANIAFLEYLPFDFAPNARFCLATLNPRLLVFVKFDLWPNLIWEAHRSSIPTILIDGTLSRKSFRFSRVGRFFYRAVYEEIPQILAISDDDARRFRDCAPDHPSVTVAGDTRYDRVMERKRAVAGRDGTENGRLAIVAGSTWPKDEVHLLGAIQRLVKVNSHILFVIVPHEPEGPRVASLVRWAESSGMDVVTLGSGKALPASDRPQVLVVDTVGRLAETYHMAHAAYVGGGFSTGVHNVIEPAIMGIPVMFGPSHENSFEAIQLLRERAAIEVGNESEIYQSLKRILDSEDLRSSMGRRALAFVESQLGATERCMKAIEGYL